MADVTDAVTILAEEQLQRRQQVAECSTAMKDPLSQVNYLCVCVCDSQSLTQ